MDSVAIIRTRATNYLYLYSVLIILYLSIAFAHAGIIAEIGNLHPGARSAQRALVYDIIQLQYNIMLIFNHILLMSTWEL